jgi:ABC-type nitrate/sulfonate/bicarbonate transport system ATPase subunit
VIQEGRDAGKAVALIGKLGVGKHTLINLMYKSQAIYFNPEVMGTFRELYGGEDPISQVQQL